MQRRFDWHDGQFRCCDFAMTFELTALDDDQRRATLARFWRDLVGPSGAFGAIVTIADGWTTSLGAGRIWIVHALRRSKNPTALDALRSLADDPQARRPHRVIQASGLRGADFGRFVRRYQIGDRVGPPIC